MVSYAYASDRLPSGAGHGYALYQMAVVAKGRFKGVAIIIKTADQTPKGKLKCAVVSTIQFSFECFMLVAKRSG